MIAVFAILLIDGLITEEKIVEYESKEYLEKVLEKVEELKESY